MAARQEKRLDERIRLAAVSRDSRLARPLALFLVIPAFGQLTERDIAESTFWESFLRMADIIGALLARRSLLLTEIDRLVKTYGEESVLYENGAGDLLSISSMSFRTSSCSGFRLRDALRAARALSLCPVR